MMMYNWNKITTEEIIKHKEILDNQTGIEAILKTLATLKKRNPTKDILLSTGIDASLKKMVIEHNSSLVTDEVRKLLIHWKLEAPVKSPAVVVKFQPLVATTLKPKSNDIKETIEVSKTPDPVIKAGHLTKVSETQSENELSILKVVSKCEEKEEECKENTADQIYKMQTEKTICKKPLVSEYRKKEINRRLQSAITIFMEELGKQEVKMYLDDLALKCCDY
ncbi:hypothetical protein JTE90_006597 [Oedothorax gibbosus]|uniref:TFIIS N-terminal domain-containing protein n=1 Tax=Oedothorax gibbosus TaxID=931172 RepID=A0AAV6U3V5_9ARAC|nr:hypothetical protein JTE90_006597 [Oedothorax gibbosus]